MKQYLYLLIVPIILSGCDMNSDNKNKTGFLSITEEYVSSNLGGDTTKLNLENGIIVLGDEYKTYVIDPEKIFIGYLDQDTKKDAIVSLSIYLGNTEVTSEHLFIINTGGKLTLIRSLESDMRILNIEDGVITAEIPEHSRNSPLFNCPSCWEVVNYRFINGELSKIE